MATNLLSNPNTIMLLVFFMGITIANMLSKGLIATLIKIRIFKQGNIVVCVNHNIEDYYVPGSLDSGVLNYTGRKRADNPVPKRILTIPQKVLDKAIFKSFNLPNIMVDDVKNSIFIRKDDSYESIGGFNAEAMSEKIDTALKKPPEDEVLAMPQKTFQLIVIGGILIICVGGYYIYSVLKKHDANTARIYDMVVPLYNALNSTG